MTWSFRPTVRLRLTLIYAGLFFVAGVFLLALMYALVAQALEPPDAPPGQDGERWQVTRATPVPGSDGEWQGTLPQSQGELQSRLDAARDEQRAEALRQVQVQAAIALVVTSVGALGLGWFYAGRMLRPIRDITIHARELSESTLDRRIALAGPDDEITELADTIDRMLERLETAFESQRRFAAQASHELRTPLAVIGAEADIAMAAPGASEREVATAAAVREQVTRAERLVNSLLVLARSESTMRDDTTVDLADLAGDVMGEQIGDADAAGIRVDLELDTAVTSGDPLLLKHMIGNMVANAIRYNEPGGFLHLEAFHDPQWSCVRVTNSGPIVPDGDLERLFHPFQRGTHVPERREGGFGLGLAIIRSVIAVHDGELLASARADGGLVLTARLPQAKVGTGNGHHHTI